MVTIRLTRRGAKNQPFYHVVVTDSRAQQSERVRALVAKHRREAGAQVPAA